MVKTGKIDANRDDFNAADGEDVRIVQVRHGDLQVDWGVDDAWVRCDGQADIGGSIRIDVIAAEFEIHVVDRNCRILCERTSKKT